MHPDLQVVLVTIMSIGASRGTIEPRRTQTSSRNRLPNMLMPRHPAQGARWQLSIAWSPSESIVVWHRRHQRGKIVSSYIERRRCSDSIARQTGGCTTLPDVAVADTNDAVRVDRACFRALQSMRGSCGVCPSRQTCPILHPAKIQSYAAPELPVKVGSASRRPDARIHSVRNDTPGHCKAIKRSSCDLCCPNGRLVEAMREPVAATLLIWWWHRRDDAGRISV
jgi:hypothetical protein